MKIENETELGVIDFQDAVIGADTYDLISITRDAYVQWNTDRVYRWFKVFYDLLPAAAKQDRDFEQFKRCGYDGDSASYQDFRYFLYVYLSEMGNLAILKDLPRVMGICSKKPKTIQNYSHLCSLFMKK